MTLTDSSEEYTRLCLACKKRTDVVLVPESRGLRNLFTDGNTYQHTNDECEVCGASSSLMKEGH